MKHNLNFYLDWCEWCGRPCSEILDQSITECDGTPGRIHPRFFEAQTRAHSLFDPIVTKVVEGFVYIETLPDHSDRAN